MSRPLMQHGVGQLEEMFAKARADPKLLKQLEHELQYRQVPRATVLLAEVQAAMYGGAPAPPQLQCPLISREGRPLRRRGNPAYGSSHRWCFPPRRPSLHSLDQWRPLLIHR